MVRPTFLCVELSSSVIDLLFFPLSIDVLGQNYVLKGMVRCISRHFTVAIKYDNLRVYIDDMCSSVRNYSYCQDLWQSHPKGWFFAIFEKSLITRTKRAALLQRCRMTSRSATKELQKGWLQQ